MPNKGIFKRPFPTSSGLSEGLSSGVYSFGYNFDGPGTELIPPAEFFEVEMTGTFVISTVITPSYRYYHRLGKAAGTHTFKWFTSTTPTGTETQTGSAATYTIPSGDAGKYLRMEATPLVGGMAGVAITTRRQLISGAFDPFSLSWDMAFKWDTNDFTQYGTGAAITNVGGVSFDSGVNMMRFTRATPTYITSQISRSVSNPNVFYGSLRVTTSFNGVQTVIGLSGTHNMTISSAGLVSISGVSTGKTLSLNTVYAFKIVINGTSSTWNISTPGTPGTDTAISLSTNSIGTPLIRFGANFGNTNNWNGWLGPQFYNVGALSSPNDLNMRTYLGIN